MRAELWESSVPIPLSALPQLGLSVQIREGKKKKLLRFPREWKLVTFILKYDNIVFLGTGPWGTFRPLRVFLQPPCHWGVTAGSGGRGMGMGALPRAPRTVSVGLFIPGSTFPNPNTDQRCLSWRRVPVPALAMKTLCWLLSVVVSIPAPLSSPVFSQHLSPCTGISHSLLAACLLGKRERRRGKLGG